MFCTSKGKSKLFLISNLIILSTASIASASDVEEVIVTHSKSEASIQDIASPIYVINTDDFDPEAAHNLEEGVFYLPEVINSDFGAAVGQPVIRGLSGSRVRILSNDPMNRVVPGIGADHTGGMDMYDTERIEVLKGPQGTLYGSDAIGGVLDGRNKKPEFNLSIGSNLCPEIVPQQGINEGSFKMDSCTSASGSAAMIVSENFAVGARLIAFEGGSTSTTVTGAFGSLGMDGLDVSLSYTDSSNNGNNASPTGWVGGISYEAGRFTFSATTSDFDGEVGAVSGATTYGITYAVNDNISIGYSHSEMEGQISAGEDLDSDSDYIYASYAVASGVTAILGYTQSDDVTGESAEFSTRSDREMWTFSLSMDF